MEVFSPGGVWDETAWDRLAPTLAYHQLDVGDPAGCRGLAELLAVIDAVHETAGNRLVYLATPPTVSAEIVLRLGEARLAHETGWTRIVEKPFGHPLASARALNPVLRRFFQEEQIYRIDHYRGKETVQNIFARRFANGLFEPLWSRASVDQVQITVAEPLGVGDRAGHYEEAGVVRDMLRNHLLQLVALVALEPPASLDADAVPNEKLRVLRAIRPLDPPSPLPTISFGQHGVGVVNGAPAPGYHDEPGVFPTSTTPTFVALKREIDNRRCAGVPFSMRTGKRLPKRVTEIAIHVRPSPHRLYPDAAAGRLPKWLVLHLQPEEGIGMTFGVHAPEAADPIRTVRMDFAYKPTFGCSPTEADERLLLDALRGDATVFTRQDEAEADWALVQPLLDRVGSVATDEAGTWGPTSGVAFLAREGRRWRRR